MPTKAVTRVQTFCLLFWSSCQGLLLLGNCSRPDVQAVPPQRSESLGSTDAHLGKHTPPFAQPQGHVVALCKTTLKTLKDSAHRVVAVAVAVAMAVTSNNIQPPSSFFLPDLGPHLLLHPSFRSYLRGPSSQESQGLRQWRPRCLSTF